VVQGDFIGRFGAVACAASLAIMSTREKAKESPDSSISSLVILIS